MTRFRAWRKPKRMRLILVHFMRYAAENVGQLGLWKLGYAETCRVATDIS
jgi:hypothetical protein